MRDVVDEHVETWARELPGLDPIKEEILARMARIVREVSEGRARGVAAGGAAPGEYKTLLMLRKQGEPYQLSPSALARVLGVSRAVASTRLGVLEDKGLVRRAHDTHDRRRVTVELTSAGHTLVDALLEGEERRERDILRPLDEDEQNELAELLRRVVLHLPVTD
ncbi:MarR family winged helix-turn-helix transcriptional regulator [Nocardioides sp. zg-1228]|uniref:MarR family winged helix-turn-helix transcriptional regulator n=1 Tax=Nocardioides sp. zg-1228 TaxID=2763008 RepID=UPI001642DBCB|nr:MarR family transcriptional regulator [Nocardioides sp. zg-1228]MBC2932500.1 MarR family transcriptional regulator [Nocardioides sp. zg-1228]QSF58004.1 MarR family transcriptional regulator [Nocardioides sp. zg-1228]